MLFFLLWTTHITPQIEIVGPAPTTPRPKTPALSPEVPSWQRSSCVCLTSTWTRTDTPGAAGSFPPASAWGRHRTMKVGQVSGVGINSHINTQLLKDKGNKNGPSFQVTFQVCQNQSVHSRGPGLMVPAVCLQDHEKSLFLFKILHPCVSPLTLKGKNYE